MSNACPNCSCVSWRPNTAFLLNSSRLTTGCERRSFHSHRISFKEDHTLTRTHREGCWKQIHCFYAKLKSTNEFEVEETCTLTSDCHVGYRVKEGDTLTAIANKFNTKVQSIAVANKIVDVNYVPAGKLLLIPWQSIDSDQINSKNHQPLVDIKNITKDGVNNSSLQSENILQKFPENTSSSVFQVHQNIRDAKSQSRVRRWEGILKEDETLDEANMEAFPDEQTISDLEDEDLEESYAELETMYIQFLADSGLSTSGYWRGGAQVASDKD